jgi:glycosyltransferase involved in cell wall biosynthesis
MEAMACGTPVLSFPLGALASMIAPGRTGFLAESVSEMAVAIRRAPEIDERACRHEALTRFSADRMADQYIDLYNALAAHAVRPAKCAGSAEDATNAFNS